MRRPRSRLARVVLSLALPRLRELPEANWNEAIRRARREEFDQLEQAAILCALGFVSYLLRNDADAASGLIWPVRYLVLFGKALVLLLPLAGPFYVRRFRRGLDRYLVPPNSGSWIPMPAENAGAAPRTHSQNDQGGESPCKET